MPAFPTSAMASPSASITEAIRKLPLSLTRFAAGGSCLMENVFWPIASKSGEQASIPGWADRAYLGWLIRCIDDPRTFVPRYLKAFRLVYLLARYGATPPPIVSHAG